MRTIFKYKLAPPLETTVVLDLPKSAEILHVGEQDNTIEMWALVETSHYVSKRRFYLAMTGEDLNVLWSERFRHLGTVMLERGKLVVHVFELL